MKILEKLFSRRPPEPLGLIDLQNPRKRSRFRQQFIAYYGKGKVSEIAWFVHENKWCLLCPGADSEILKRYKYLRKARPEKPPTSPQNFWEQKTPPPVDETPICYVSADHIAHCPICSQGYKNVSGPFPKKVTCRRCKEELKLLLLDEK